LGEQGATPNKGTNRNKERIKEHLKGCNLLIWRNEHLQRNSKLEILKTYLGKNHKVILREIQRENKSSLPM